MFKFSNSGKKKMYKKENEMKENIKIRLKRYTKKTKKSINKIIILLNLWHSYLMLRTTLGRQNQFTKTPWVSIENRF